MAVRRPSGSGGCASPPDQANDQGKNRVARGIDRPSNLWYCVRTEAFWSRASGGGPDRSHPDGRSGSHQRPTGRRRSRPGGPARPRLWARRADAAPAFGGNVEGNGRRIGTRLLAASRSPASVNPTACRRVTDNRDALTSLARDGPAGSLRARNADDCASGCRRFCASGPAAGSRPPSSRRSPAGCPVRPSPPSHGLRAVVDSANDPRLASRLRSRQAPKAGSGDVERVGED